jgi:hypothetical protein
MAIPNIEGGFGPNQRAILAKDVAEFHDKELHHVNQTINRNIDKFEEAVDYIDVKEYQNLVIALTDNKILTQKSVNRSKNIYLLSGLGYYKITKTN